MTVNISLDTSVAIRILNGEIVASSKILKISEIFLSPIVVGELLFGAENSRRSIKNLPKYLEFIKACRTIPLDGRTAEIYSQVRLALKQKGRPIPMNDIWIAAQCIEHDWILVTDDSDFDYIDYLKLERW